MGQGRRITLVSLGIVVALTGCQWSQSRFDAGATANNTTEVSVGAANIATLQRSWSITGGTTGSFFSVLVRGGRVFTPVTGGVGALDARDGAPLWSVGPRDTSPDHAAIQRVVAVDHSARIGGDAVFVTELDLSRLPTSETWGSVSAYNAATGGLLWSKPIGGATSAVLLDGRLFVTIIRQLGTADDFSGTVALDPETGTELFRVPGLRVAAGAGGMVFGSTSFAVSGFSASGCGLPVCETVWTTSGPSAVDANLAVANGLLYLATPNGLAVFAAAGCGAALCAPVWTAAGSYGQIAVTETRIFLTDSLFHGNGPNVLSAFDATGCRQATCTPLWTSGTPAEYFAPSVANGLVYASSRGAPTVAWPVTGCGAPTCAPVWSVTDTLNVPINPIVVGGRLYLGGQDLITYALPAAA